MLILRPAALADLEAIREIFNEAILTTSATFETKPRTRLQQEQWFFEHDPCHPVLVADWKEQVAGWASLSKWSELEAYAGTAEVSLYVKEDYRGKGIGRKLLQAVVKEGERVGFHTALARITAGNEASIHLHREVGFKHVGIKREVGRKFGRLRDVIIMQKIYSHN